MMLRTGCAAITLRTGPREQEPLKQDPEAGDTAGPLLTFALLLGFGAWVHVPLGQLFDAVE